MEVTLTWPAIGIMLTVVGHGGFSIWWAAKITFQVENLNKLITKLNSGLEERDKQIAAAWRRLDILGNRVTAIEAMLPHHQNREEQ